MATIKVSVAIDKKAISRKVRKAAEEALRQEAARQARRGSASRVRFVTDRAAQPAPTLPERFLVRCGPDGRMRMVPVTHCDPSSLPVDVKRWWEQVKARRKRTDTASE